MFEKLAPYYDFIVSLFFGNKIHETQVYFFDQIPKNSSVLIIGGGGGKILKELVGQQSQKITYVELSSKMLELAKSKSEGLNINFIHGNENDIPQNELFDIIITPFVLDCYNDHEISKLIVYLKTKININGKWFFSDFNYSDKSKLMNFISKIIIGTLYFFYRLVNPISAKKVSNFELIFNQNQFQIVNRKLFLNGLLVSLILSKNN